MYGAVSLEGKYIVVTSGAHGMGRAVAQILYYEGCNVTATSRRPAEYANLTDPVICYKPVDGAIESQVEDLWQTSLAQLPSIDIVFHDIGVASFGQANFWTGDSLIELININLASAMRTIRRAYKLMGQTDGFKKIYVVSLTFGQYAGPDVSAYTVAKFGVEGLAAAKYRQLLDTQI